MHRASAFPDLRVRPAPPPGEALRPAVALLTPVHRNEAGDRLAELLSTLRKASIHYRSQDKLAAALGIVTRTYFNYEHGIGQGGMPEEIIEKICVLLKVPPLLRAQIYRLSRGHEPPLRPTSLAALGDENLSDFLRHEREELDHLPYPAYICDGAWNTLVANDAFRAMVSGIAAHPQDHPEHNVMRFVVFNRQAAELLPELEAKWLLPMLANFAISWEANPTDPGLNGIGAGIAMRPALRSLFDHHVPQLLRTPIDGGLRPLVHPQWGRTQVRVVVYAPSDYYCYGFRRVSLRPTGPRRLPPAERTRPTAAPEMRSHAHHAA